MSHEENKKSALSSRDGDCELDVDDHLLGNVCRLHGISDEIQSKSLYKLLLKYGNHSISFFICLYDLFPSFIMWFASLLDCVMVQDRIVKWVSLGFILGN